MDDQGLRRNLRLQHVPRWGIVPTVRKQTVAEHSHGVAAIVLWLLNRGLDMGQEPNRSSILEYAIRHDEYESMTGDTPATAKMVGLVVDNTPKHAFSATTKNIVKVADFIEALLFICSEEAMGNKTLDSVFTFVFMGACNYWDENNLDRLFGLPEFKELWWEVSRAASANIHPGMEKL